MGLDVRGIFLVYADKKIIERLPFYLQEGTRPDFPDEVSENEKEWVEVFEFIDYPDDIKLINSSHLIFSFSPEQGGDREEMSKLGESLINTVGVNRILLYLSSEIEASVDLFSQQGQKRLFDYIDEDQSYISDILHNSVDNVMNMSWDELRKNNRAEYYDLLFCVMNDLQ